MWVFVFIVLLVVHGCIHLLGFIKSYSIAPVKQLRVSISHRNGWIWFASGVLCLLASILLLLQVDYWPYIIIIMVVLSQWIIVSAWKDARYGTLVNLVLLVGAIMCIGLQTFENKYKKDVADLISLKPGGDTSVVTLNEIEHLPTPVKKYLEYCGVLGQPKVYSMKVEMSGDMRDKGKDWFSFNSEQYNRFDDPQRLFFMKATMFGITVPGYHKYKNGKAVMDIRLFGLYPIVFHSGNVMDTTETVTFFNDLCLMAPSALTDKKIIWQELDSLSVKATFIHKGITISAVLQFDKTGKLTNFFSNDRTSISDMRKYLFSTPVRSYKENNGRHLIADGDAVWHYDDGAFTYGKFKINHLQYNIKQ